MPLRLFKSLRFEKSVCAKTKKVEDRFGLSTFYDMNRLKNGTREYLQIVVSASSRIWEDSLQILHHAAQAVSGNSLPAFGGTYCEPFLHMSSNRSFSMCVLVCTAPLRLLQLTQLADINQEIFLQTGKISYF